MKPDETRQKMILAVSRYCSFSSMILLLLLLCVDIMILATTASSITRSSNLFMNRSSGVANYSATFISWRRTTSFVHKYYHHREMIGQHLHHKAYNHQKQVWRHYSQSHLQSTHQTQTQQHHHTSSSSIVELRIQDLKTHPAVVWDESSTFASMSKKKLSRRHLHLFDRRKKEEVVDHYEYQDHLFDKFATVICNAGVVARKEVFETWASALYIHYAFISTDDANGSSNSDRIIRRIVDVAAGHGLLAWALLLLSDEEERNKNTKKKNQQEQHPLTVFCLDVQMPPSAELIHEAMIQQWPHLNDRFDYVEARLEQLVPHQSCLLASVHACGILSDMLISTAAKHQIPIALVPCCHSRKRKLLEESASPYAKREYDEILNAKESLPNLADLLDNARMVALENAGCDVKELFIPDLFTGKNRLILGSPTTRRSDAIQYTPSDEKIIETERSSRQLLRKGQMPPLIDNEKATTVTKAINPKARFMKGFYVPCEDSKESRKLVSSISGRTAAIKRKELMHNRNNSNAPQMDLSLWLSSVEDFVSSKGEGKYDDKVLLTKEALSTILKTISPEYVRCEVSQLDLYTNPTNGRKSQTFRVQYNHEIDGEAIPFDEAKLLHAQLRDILPLKFPGVECR